MRRSSARIHVAGAMMAFVMMGGLAAAIPSAAQAECNGCTGPGPQSYIESGPGLYTVGGQIVHCQDDYWTAATGWVETGCENQTTGTGCNTGGHAAGEIVTNPLTLSYGVINRAESIMGVEFKSKGKFVAFECGKEHFEAKGAVIADMTPVSVLVTPPESYTAVFAQIEGRQVPTNFEGGKPTQLEFKVTEGKTKEKVPGTFESTESITYTEPSELSPVKKKK